MATSLGLVLMQKLTLLLGLTIFSLPQWGYAKEFRFEYQKVLHTGPEAELDIRFISGDLEIVSGDGDEIVIEAIKRVNSVNMDEAGLAADHVEIKVNHDKRKVQVTTNYLRMRNRGQSFWSKVLGTGGEDSYGEVDWRISVPPLCHLTIVNTSGRINISHLLGNIEIRSSAADITLNSIEGDINIDNGSGSTVGDLLFGSVSVQQAQGKIELNFIEGDTWIKSVTADISVRQERGSLDLTTASGNIDIQTNLDGSRDYFVNTESGHITLTIPETSSGDLRIESQTGNIRTDIPIVINSMSHKQVDGTFGFGGVKIKLTSITGDVTVAQF